MKAARYFHQRLGTKDIGAARYVPWLLGLTLACPVQAQQQPREVQEPQPQAAFRDVDTSVPASAAAPEAPAALTPAASAHHYALGMAYGWSPTYVGSNDHKSYLRPVLSLQYGRFRFSSSRGNAVLNHGFDDRGSGASALLVERARFHLSTSVRIDGGRSNSDDPLLQGLPEVRSTLRGRISAGYALSERWSVNAGLSQDLLGRSGGAQLNTSLRYALDLTPQTTVGVGLGAAFANSTYMRSHFGVPASAVGTSPLSPFAPAAGLYNVDMGLDVMTALSRRWVVFANAGVSQLRGDARRSPLTQRATNYGVLVGVAYRCCR